MSPHARLREWWLFVAELDKPDPPPDAERSEPGTRRPITRFHPKADSL
jgi:hypothetical protein